MIAQSGSAAIELMSSGRLLRFSIIASTGNEAVVATEGLEVMIDDIVDVPFPRPPAMGLLSRPNFAAIACIRSHFGVQHTMIGANAVHV